MVTYLTAGAKKTSFAGFNVGEWHAKMLPVLCDLRKGVPKTADAVIELVDIFKDELERQDACSLQPEAAKQGETVLFDGRDLHWGNASEDEDLRFVVYSQAVSRLLVDKWCNDKALLCTVLTTYYSAEYVVDRRTIASPTFLYNLWLYASPDVLKGKRSKLEEKGKDLWKRLSALACGHKWPSQVCQCCVGNDSVNMAFCNVTGCFMGAIHPECMLIAVDPEKWKCSSCLTSGQ